MRGHPPTASQQRELKAAFHFASPYKHKPDLEVEDPCAELCEVAAKTAEFKVTEKQKDGETYYVIAPELVAAHVVKPTLRAAYSICADRRNKADVESEFTCIL